MAKKTTPARAEAPKSTVTLKTLTARAANVRDSYQAWLHEDDETREEDAFAEYAKQRQALIKQIEPLLDLLTDGGCFDAMLSPDMGSDRDEDRYLRFKPSDHWIDEDGEYVLFAKTPYAVTIPPPPLSQNEEPELDDPSVFIRIPVTAHAVFAEMWKHEGLTTRVLHTRPILADSSHVEFVDSEFELLSIQPTGVDTFAVFGSASDDIDLREETNDIEQLLANDRALFLGFQHGEIPVDWASRLRAIRDDESEAEESPGVFLRGEYRQMPKLDLDDSPPNGDER